MGFDVRTVQPVESCYSKYAVPVHIIIIIIIITIITIIRSLIFYKCLLAKTISDTCRNVHSVLRHVKSRSFAGHRRNLHHSRQVIL